MQHVEGGANETCWWVGCGVGEILTQTPGRRDSLRKELGRAVVGTRWIAGACDRPEGAIQGASLQSRTFWVGLGLGQGSVGIACRWFACLGFPGPKTLTRSSEGGL